MTEVEQGPESPDWSHMPTLFSFVLAPPAYCVAGSALFIEDIDRPDNVHLGGWARPGLAAPESSDNTQRSLQ